MLLFDESPAISALDRVLRALFKYIGMKPSTTLVEAAKKGGQLELNVDPIITQTYGSTGWQVNIDIQSIVITPSPYFQEIYHRRSKLHGATNVNKDGAIMETNKRIVVDYNITALMSMDASTHLEAINRVEHVQFAATLFKGEIIYEAKLRDFQLIANQIQQTQSSESPSYIASFVISFITSYVVEFNLDYRETGILGKMISIVEYGDESE